MRAQPESLTSLRTNLHLSSPEPRGPALASSPGHVASGSRSSSSTVSLELGWTESEDERLTVERVQQTRRQLQDEIEVSESESLWNNDKCYKILLSLQLIVRELTLVGDELHLEAECQKIVQD